MKSRHFLIPAVLSVAGMLMASDFAQAQRGRGGAGGGRGAVVVGGRGAVVVGGGYRGPYYGYGYRGYGYGYGFGLGYGWGYPYYGFGLGIGLGGYAPIYGYAYDTYASPGAYAYAPAAGGFPADQSAPATQGLPEGSASIRLILPDPNAVVFFDGNKTTQTGGERMFHTPPLAPGAKSSYRIRAIVRQNGKDLVLEQVVPVSPGQNITVDFTRPHSEGIAPPAGKE